MRLSRRRACLAWLVLLVLLFVGTQMPGAWRDAAFEATHLPWQMTKVAHCVLFACMAWLARVPPLRQSAGRVLAGALVLAVLTEALQHLASHRDPSLRDVGIDLGGAGLGLLLARATWLRF